MQIPFEVPLLAFLIAMLVAIALWLMIRYVRGAKSEKYSEYEKSMESFRRPWPPPPPPPTPTPRPLPPRGQSGAVKKRAVKKSYGRLIRDD